MSGSPPCVLCDERWPVPGPETYQDIMGFRYALCAPHRATLVEGLRRIATRRLVKALPRRTPKRNRRQKEAGRVTTVPTAPGLCAFCHPPLLVPATVAYTDVFGFRFELCVPHRDVLVAVLSRGAEPAPDLPGPRLRLRMPTRRERREAPAVSGEDQRRARKAQGYSLRRLAAALDRSYSQLQGAEAGHRPVDPVVAAWAQAVLSGDSAGGGG